jgi:hypothetical protein
MSIIERSINFYRQSFKIFAFLTFIILVLIGVNLFNHGYYVLMAFMLTLTTIVMGIPLNWDYKNWKYLERNKEQLELATQNLNHLDKRFIISMKSMF